MAGKGSTGGTAGKLLQFFFKFIFKLTASLVVELLKFGALSVMLVASFSIFFFAFVYAILRSYVTSDGNVFYTLSVTIGMVLLAVVAFGVLQYIVKDVLKLTDMTLLEVVRMWLWPKTGAKEKTPGTAVEGGDKSRISETDKDLKDKTL